jgi:hypothetical protein
MRALSTLPLPVVILSLLSSSAQAQTNSSSKRGLCYIATDHSESDASLFTRRGSPLTWYYNYSPWPGPGNSLRQWSTQFVPMIHSAGEAESSVGTLQNILAGQDGGAGANQITHVLSFNEPDGDTSSGGSDSSPQHAAQVFLDTLAPLRDEPYNLLLSLPATTGSSRGIEWLQDFNSSCYKLNRTHGCEIDFVATHWYGDFAGLTSWLGQIHELYPDQKIWLTEFAIPSVDEDETQAFLNQSLPYLDGLEYVERYAWFGSTREEDANGWTGDGVSLLDDDGGLTQLGSTWMGGQKDGFGVGTTATGNDGGEDNGAAMLWWDKDLMLFTVAAMAILQYLW